MGSKAVKNVRTLILRKEAIERQKERADRSPVEQLAKLDVKLGAGKGAVKERTRLTQMIADSKKKPKEVVEEILVQEVEALETEAPRKRSGRAVKKAEGKAKPTPKKRAKGS